MGRFATIQTKVFCVIAALTLALVGFLATYFPAQQIESAHRALKSKAVSYAALVAMEVQSGIAFNDKQTVREVFEALANDRDVSALALYKADGRLLYAVGELEHEGRHAPMEGILLERSEHVLRAVAPVVSKEGPTGTLYLELSTDAVAEAKASIERVALLVGLGALIAGMAAAWLIGRSLARRLGVLAEATQSVAAGNLDGVPLHDASADEVGQLTRAFGVMRGNLRELVERVRLAGEREQERLDRLVRERTSELNSSLARYRTLVESTHAVPWEMDGTALRLTYISPQVTKLFTHEVSTLLGTDAIWQLIHDDDRERVRLAFTALGNSTGPQDLDIEYRSYTADRRLVHVRSAVSTTGGMPDGYTVLRGITFDVTSQKKLELELRQAQKLESVGRLASGVAHEINTPVQFVGDSVHFARDSIAELIGVLGKHQSVTRSVLEGTPSRDAAESARAAEGDADLEYMLENLPKALERSLEGLERVTTIVRSMKEFAHPDATEMTAIDLNQAIQSTLVIARNEYKYVADVLLDLEEIPRVTCHAGEINQVVLNIVVNGAHAIAERVAGGADRGRIGVRTRRDGQSVVIAISDTGGGIPEAVRERIYDPFFTTKAVGKGTGQGLAIARSVVCDKHGGELGFETELGGGTTFTIRLPIEGTKKQAEAA